MTIKTLEIIKIICLLIQILMFPLIVNCIFTGTIILWQNAFIILAGCSFIYSLFLERRINGSNSICQIIISICGVCGVLYFLYGINQ